MIRRGTIRTRRFGWVVVALVLAVGGCTESGTSTGGTPAPTKTPSGETPLPTITKGGATATPTATPAPDHFAGDYAATIELDDGEEAHLNLTVLSDNQATGTLELVGSTARIERRRAAVIAQSVAVSIGLVTLAGSIDPGDGSFHFAGNIDGPDGPIPFDISGNLPRSPGGSGDVMLTIDGETYTSSIARGTGPTPLPTQPGASPTPADGCGGGTADATFSEVVGVNANQPLDTVVFGEIEGTRSMVTAGLFSFGGKAANCPVPVNGVVRLLGWSILNGTDFVAGTTFEVGGGPLNQPWTKIDYREVTTGPSQQVWEAESGSLTIESIEGTTYRIRIADAHMKPGAPFIFGPPPLGTFTLNATVTISSVGAP